MVGALSNDGVCLFVCLSVNLQSAGGATVVVTLCVVMHIVSRIEATHLCLCAALADAMRSRKQAALEKAISVAERAGMERRLGVQLAMARRILEQLRRIEKLRNAIMNLDQRTIAEIKSYSSPPVAVNHVMTATFLLLGEPEKRMQVKHAEIGLIILWKEFARFHCL